MKRMNHKKRKHGKKNKKHHRKAHSVKNHHRQSTHQHKVVSSDEAAPTMDQGHKVNSEDFTRGRFDTSETLVQGHHHGHTKKHHLTQHKQHHSAPKHNLANKDKDPAQEEKEMEETYEKEEAAAAEVGKVKAQQEAVVKAKRDYEWRMQNANEFDGLVRLPNGQKMFTDDGAMVDGVNLYSQQHHPKHKDHTKHATQHHKTHKKVAHHKKHKSHVNQKHVQAPESQ